MTLTEYYDIICEKLGVDPGNLMDKLRTTYLDAICEKLGIDVGALPDKIRTTYLDAICKNMGVDVNDLQDRLVITYLGAILEKKGVDVDALPDRLLNTYLDAIVTVLDGGSGGGGGVDWSQYTYALYNGVRLPKMPEDVLASYPYVWIRDNGSTGYYDLMFAKGIWHLYYANALNHNDNDNVEWYRIEKTDANATEWVFNQSISSGAWGIDENRVCIWSNHDIPNGPATATDIWFEGTEPVPSN